jgi:fatty acid/phospholipid biosynthesis enzyme
MELRNPWYRISERERSEMRAPIKLLAPPAADALLSAPAEGAALAAGFDAMTSEWV